MGAAILDVSAAIPHYFLRHQNLAAARGVRPTLFSDKLGCEEMAVCGPGDDAVSLAASAGWRLLSRNPTRKSRIGLCVVGTESGVDAARPVAIHVHGLLGLPSSCRVFEVKHACYGPTAGLQVAKDWARSHPGRLALVVAADVARHERYSPGEAIQGAAGVAMLVGDVPEGERMIELSLDTGVFATDVYDTWQPTYKNTTLMRADSARSCYLEALERAYLNYRESSGDDTVFDYLLFHVPYPRVARDAHRRLVALDGLEDPVAVGEDFQRRVAPSLWIHQRVGNVFGGSLYLSLAALCEEKGEELAGSSVGFFAYGSGCCGEFFRGSFAQHIPDPGLRSLVEMRREVSVPLYEAITEQTLAMERNQSFDEDVPVRGQPFTFLGIRDHQRLYRQNLLWRIAG